MAETNSLQEHLGRVQLMAAGYPTWDLSENDMAALTAVLSALTTTARERDEARAEVVRLVGEIIELPRCNDCNRVLGDNWCADCAGKIDRERAEAAESALKFVERERDEARASLTAVQQERDGMMLACQLLAKLQRMHKQTPYDTNGETNDCICPACEIPLPATLTKEDER